MSAIDPSVLDSASAVAEGVPVDKPVTPCGKQNPPCWKGFPKGAEPYEPKNTDVRQGWGLNWSPWMNVQQQHHGNCAVQAAQLLLRSAELQFGKNNTAGYSEDEMEVLANCPKKSGYSRSGGTLPDPSRNMYENAGMILCPHAHHPTPENIQRALKYNYPVSTGHDVKDLWGDPTGGGHQVATVGCLKDQKTGRVTAYLVYDTGQGCVYYVSKHRYEKSLLTSNNIIVVIGIKKNCKDSKGNPVKPGACCLAAYKKRKEALAQSLSSAPAAKAPKDSPHQWEEYYKKQARDAQKRIEELKTNYDFSQQMQALSEDLGDKKSAAAWKTYCDQDRAEWQKEYDQWKKAKEDLLAKQEKITPMGTGDPGADADRKSCGDAAKTVKCEEQRSKCPICGK